MANRPKLFVFVNPCHDHVTLPNEIDRKHAIKTERERERSVRANIDFQESNWIIECTIETRRSYTVHPQTAIASYRHNQCVIRWQRERETNDRNRLAVVVGLDIGSSTRVQATRDSRKMSLLFQRLTLFAEWERFYDTHHRLVCIGM